MANRGEGNKLNWPRWQQVLLIALLAVIFANRMTMLVNTAAMRAGLYGQLPWTGAYSTVDPEAEPGFLKVIQVDPGSPMARAGVRPGDHEATYSIYDQQRWWNAYFSSVLMLAYLAAARYQSEAAARNRVGLIFLALSALTIGGLVTGLSKAQTGFFFAADWLGYINALMMGLIAPSALAYAVLRHKLFDLDFAVNRTLVFATISAVLLTSFGTLEWAVEHLVLGAWHKGSAFFSAGIAVGLFLLFHRIRDFIERIIERLFFSSWHRNEAALKRFVAAAAHVEKPEALVGNFAAELVRFSGGATASLYARALEGHFASAAGDKIDADDPALAAMRAEQAAVVPAELASPLAAALALPMMHQAALAGFVLLGPKSTGEDYRPDEIEMLSWATQQVGLDLQAIRVRELEQQVLTLNARNANLSDILAKAAIAGT